MDQNLITINDVAIAVDFSLLQEQRDLLLQILFEKSLTKEEVEMLDGLMALLDSLLDVNNKR